MARTPSGAVLTMVAFYTLPLQGQSNTLVNGYLGMLWIFAFVGWARANVRSGGAWLAYATEAVYPFYILHQTIIVIAGYFIVQQPWSHRREARGSDVRRILRGLDRIRYREAVQRHSCPVRPSTRLK